jgi:hypothetical protein
MHYQGWSGPLNACEADAHDMHRIASGKAFAPELLLTAAATRQAVTDAIRSVSGKLKSGDIFLLSYSGHGGQLPDWSRDEADLQDETWCLYDGQLVDDEIYELLAEFEEGVRILVFSDSCHSGSAIKLGYYHGTSRGIAYNEPSPQAYRAMPEDVALRVYQANKATYDPILKRFRPAGAKGRLPASRRIRETQDRVSASALLISGCQDNQYSADGAFNGLFTGTMLRVWADGAFEGDYREFHSAIVRRMPPDQTPNYFTVGRPNPTFEGETPFTV